MRRLFLLIFVGFLLIQSGCIRERTSGDTIVLQMRWWTLVWGFIVPVAIGGIVFARHPSTWVNGKWRPWWTFHGWDAREFGYAASFLIVFPLMAVAFLFDRLEVSPDHIRESSLSPFRGNRQVAFSDIQRIEMPPPDQNQGFFGSIGKRKKKSPPAMRIFLKNGHEEDFNGQLVRYAQSTILDRARKAGAAVANAPPQSQPGETIPNAGVVRRNPGGGANAPQHSPDFDPFENAQPKFVPVDPKRK